jgi:hypothetical protein
MRPVTPFMAIVTVLVGKAVDSRGVVMVGKRFPRA